MSRLDKPERRKFRQETVIHSFIIRPLSIEIIRLIWHTPVTANQITAFRIGLNILALLCFLQATLGWIITGFMLFQIHELLDSVDGMYARLKNQRSTVGVWMEQFFDTLFSDGNGFLGLILTYSAYVITGNVSYFIWLGISTSAIHMFDTFIKVFGLSKKQQGFEHKVYGNDYLPILGVGTIMGIKNFYITLLAWQNQLLLWGILFLIPVYKTYGIDVYGFSVATMALINQPPWIYAGYLGYRAAIRKENAHG